MIPRVHGPWVFLDVNRAAGDDLVFDLESEDLLTLWGIYGDVEPYTEAWSRAHPNVATVTRVGIATPMSYLASPSAGVELYGIRAHHRLLEHEQLPIPIALRIAADLARGYDALGLLPGGGDPGRAFVGWDGHTRLVPAPGPTAPGMLTAKENFLTVPPEQRGDEWSRGRSTWAVGSAAFLLLTGEYPVQGDSEFERHESLRRDHRPAIRTIRPGLESNTGALIDRCLLQRSEARPALHTLAERFEALGACSREEAVGWLAGLFGDLKREIDDLREQLQAAPPAANEEMVVVPARFRRMD